MPLQWEFANAGEDCTPEIVLKALNPVTSGEKVLLFNVLNGCFGRPMIISGTSVNGQASEMIIGFGDAIGNQLLEIDKNYDNLSVIPYWNPEEYVIGNVRNIYPDDTNIGDKLIIRLSKRQKLFFKINEFDLIKDYNPIIIVERYVGAKTRGMNGQKSGAAYRTAPRKNTIPITSSMAEIDFRQEEYFRLDTTNNIRAKSYKRTNVQNAYAYFQFRLQLTINGITVKSNPVVRLKLQASLQDNNSIKGAKFDEIRTKAIAKKASTEVEVQQIKTQTEEVTSDSEREALQVKLAKVASELQEAEALIDATERPDQPDNPEVDMRYYAISYRIT